MTMAGIFDLINSLTVGDKIILNDFRRPFTVVGVSKHYVLAHTGKRYTIIGRAPAERTHNDVVAGMPYCGPDWWVFGYAGGYDFRSEQWVAEYMQSLESGETEVSLRHQAPVVYLEVSGHCKAPFKRASVTVKVDGKEIVKEHDKPV